MRQVAVSPVVAVAEEDPDASRDLDIPVPEEVGAFGALPGDVPDLDVPASTVRQEGLVVLVLEGTPVAQAHRLGRVPHTQLGVGDVLRVHRPGANEVQLDLCLEPRITVEVEVRNFHAGAGGLPCVDREPAVHRLGRQEDRDLCRVIRGQLDVARVGGAEGTSAVEQRSRTLHRVARVQRVVRYVDDVIEDVARNLVVVAQAVAVERATHNSSTARPEGPVTTVHDRLDNRGGGGLLGVCVH